MLRDFIPGDPMPDGDRFEVREVALDDSWDAFVDAAIGGHIFVHSDWLRVAEAAGAGDPVVMGAYDKDALVAAIVGVRTKGRVHRLATAPLLPHSGMLFRQPLSEQRPRQEAEQSAAWQTLAAELGGFDHIHVSCSPDVTDVREPLWAGWIAHPRYTYWIDLPPDRQQVWDGFERRTRTVIRKAETAGFHVAPASPEGFGALYQSTYPDGRPPVDAQMAQRYVTEACSAGLVEGFSALSPDGDVATTVFFALEEGGSASQRYAWVAGADPAHRESGASALLYWKVLETTPATHFDFVGANMASIALFKRGFGGELVSYYAMERWNSRWRRLLAKLRG